MIDKETYAAAVAKAKQVVAEDVVDENFIKPTNLSLDNVNNLRYALRDKDLRKYGFNIGDYFIVNSRKYYLAQCEGVLTGYHSIRLIVILPSGAWKKSSQTDTSEGAYKSNVWSTLDTSKDTIILSDLRTVFGAPSANNWLYQNVSGYSTYTYDSGDATPNSITTICAPLSETEIFGTTVFARKSTTNQPLYNRQMPLEIFKKYQPGILDGAWLRDIVDENNAACLAGAMPSYDTIDKQHPIVGQFIIGFKF